MYKVQDAQNAVKSGVSNLADEDRMAKFKAALAALSGKAPTVTRPVSMSAMPDSQGGAVRAPIRQRPAHNEEDSFTAAAKQTAPFMTAEEKARVARYLGSRIFNDDRSLGGVASSGAGTGWSNALGQRVARLG